MVNEIVESIKVCLAEEYPTHKVYLDETAQPSTPSFLVINTKTTQEQKMNNRYWREHTFDIQYFPQVTDSANKEFSKVADCLMMVLEYVKVKEDLVRGTKMNYKVEEGKFHFLVNYDLFILKEVEPYPYMETLHREYKLKLPGEN